MTRCNSVNFTTQPRRHHLSSLRRFLAVQEILWPLGARIDGRSGSVVQSPRWSSNFHMIGWAQAHSVLRPEPFDGRHGNSR